MYLIQVKTHVVNMFILCQDNLQPLHIACQMGHSSCVKVLIEDCHADPNCRAKVYIMYNYTVHTRCIFIKCPYNYTCNYIIRD